MRIRDSLAVVTGASSGIGEATALALAARGATVLLMARTPDALESVASRIRYFGGKAFTYPIDLGDASAIDSVTNRIAAEWGTPDLLVHSAGAGRWLFVDETGPADVENMMAVPYFGAFHLTRAFLPGMIDRRRGHIVTIGSPATLLMWPGAAAYIAARWALHGFTEALRADVRGLGIDVTLVIPGKVESDYFAHNPGSEDRVPRVINLTSTLSPADVAQAVLHGVERRKREIVIPFGLRLLALGHAISPRIGHWIGALTGARRPAAKTEKILKLDKSCISNPKAEISDRTA
jgi:uncharacterized protein